MYKVNDIVSMDGKIGRVLYYDALTHDLHVLNRVSENGWREEKWDPMFCRKAYAVIWDIGHAFNLKPTKYVKSPYLFPMDIDDCPVLMIG